MAAVLACGEGACLSHRSAAELWGLLPAQLGPIHVTIAASSGRARRNGLRIHHSSSLTRGDIDVRDGIMVTSPARTLADLRRTEPVGIAAKAVRAANFRGWGLSGKGQDARERSELERRFLRLCSRRHLPRPEVNARVGPYTVDFLWRAERLVVETDGWQAHRGRQAFEDDRARDALLRNRGYEVLRFSWRQVVDDPATVADLLRRYLARAA